ncbi:MAG: AmmeMemoRadiSam system protein B, partial [Vicinamibacterales bacterium]
GAASPRHPGTSSRLGPMSIRRPAVAGTWYPDSPDRLTVEVEAHLARAGGQGRNDPPPEAQLLALIVPHAGLIYSGPVAAHAYRLLRGRSCDAAVLVGPSHYMGFAGAAVWRHGSFETPLGPLAVNEEIASALLERCPEIHERPEAHIREHSLEMQLPFLAAIAPELPIVPIVMGLQTRETAVAVGDCLARVLAGRRAIVIASSDLSHFFDAAKAAFLDAQVVEDVEALDAETLMGRLEQRPEHACGGGAIVSVIRAARAMGASTSRVLKYADSGDVSGDKGSVVGYLAAAMWRS